MGYVIDRIRTDQGKARPWLLLAAPLLMITGALLFLVPTSSTTVKVIWVMVSYNLFYSFAFTIYNMSHSLMVPLSTRELKDRGELSVINNIATVMITGILVALIFPMIILPKIGVNQSAWITLMCFLSILALPFTLIEYYFTKERVTNEAEEEVPPVNYKEQLKVIFTDKFWVVIMMYSFIYTLGNNLKNISLIYFCNYVLGTYNDGVTQTMVSVIGGIPMGIGIFAVWPLAKKFGKKNVTVAGFVLYAMGSAICLIAPTNMTVVLAGQFIKSVGGLPCGYIFMALFADVLDHVEWKCGYRCDGVSMSVYSIILTVCSGLGVGIFNYLLSASNYMAPVFDKLTGETIAFAQNTATKNVFIFCFVGFEIITGIIAVIYCLLKMWKKSLPKNKKRLK